MVSLSKQYSSHLMGLDSLLCTGTAPEFLLFVTHQIPFLLMKPCSMWKRDVCGVPRCPGSWSCFIPIAGETQPQML